MANGDGVGGGRLARVSESLFSSLVGVALSAFLGGVAAGGLMTFIESQVTGGWLGTVQELITVRGEVRGLKVAVDSERGVAQARQDALIGLHGQTMTGMQALARRAEVAAVQVQVSGVSDALTGHRQLVEMVERRLTDQVDGFRRESGDLLRSSTEEVVEALGTQTRRLLAAVERLAEQQDEARRALAEEVAELHDKGEDLISAGAGSPDAIAAWLNEARFVVLGLNVLRQDGYFRRYSAAQETMDSAVKEFNAGGSLEHAQRALVVLKAVHRLVRAGLVPVHAGCRED